MRVAVLGDGSWGTALATLLGRNEIEVTLAGREPQVIEDLLSRRENLTYLPGFVLPKTIHARLLGEPLEPHDVWVLAAPSHAVGNVLSHVVGDSPSIVLAAKGLEPTSGELLSNVVARQRPSARVSALSGPNLAVEIMRSIPTAAVVANPDLEEAELIARLFNGRHFRTYVSPDLVGVELAGALKNVLAIAGGISDGLGFGDNTKGALMARGLLEMSRFGRIFGADQGTFFGISGVGDLFATAQSKLSRNYRVGFGIGKGNHLSAILAEVGQVAEGVATADAVAVLIRRHQISSPIFEFTDAVLKGQLTPLRGVEMLMDRLPKEEGWRELLAPDPAIPT